MLKRGMVLMSWIVIVSISTMATAQTVETADQKKDRAREIYKRAQVHYRVGDLKQAADEFKESYELYPAPETLYNMAQTHRLLKNYDKAIFLYRQFLNEAKPNEADAKQVKERIAEMQKSLETQTHADSAPPPAATPATANAPVIAPIAVQSTQGANRSDQREPVYKKWWLWTSVGVVVVAVGLGVGLGIGLDKSAAYRAPGVMF